MVIADFATGVRDANCNLNEEAPIDELFGLDRSKRAGIFNGKLVLRSGIDRMNADMTLFDKELDLVGKTTTASSLGRLNVAMNAGYINNYGEGKAIYLGFPIDDYVKDRYTGANSDRFYFFRNLFSIGGVEAPTPPEPAAGEYGNETE